MYKDILRVSGRTNLRTDSDKDAPIELLVQNAAIGERAVVGFRMIAMPFDLNDPYLIVLRVDLDRAEAAMEWLSQFANPDSVPTGAHELKGEPSFETGKFVVADAYVRRGKALEELAVTLRLQAGTAESEGCLGMRMYAPKSGGDGQWFASVEMNRLQAHIFCYMLEINCTVAGNYVLFSREFKKK
jgi:hypothetical protein